MKRNIGVFLALSGLLFVSSAAIADTGTVSAKNNARKAVQVPAIEVDDSKAVSALPKIPDSKPLSPNLAEVQAWNNKQKSDYVHEAKAHIPAAEQRVHDAERLFKQAQAAVRGIVPNSRAYGESEDHFKDRYAAANKRMQQLIEPYQDHVTACQRDLTNAQAAYDSCQAAYRGLTDGWQPVGGTEGQ